MATQIKRASYEPFFKPFKGPKVNTRTPLKAESDKRKLERVIYSEKRKAYLDTHVFCEFYGCRRIATDIHHRERRGANYLDESTFMALCRQHHRWAHQSPKEARALGLLT